MECGERRTENGEWSETVPSPVSGLRFLFSFFLFIMYLIFTDLDGTLLDFDTYSFDKAKEILSYIREQNIPLVAVTSKTAAEVQQILKTIGIYHPFVVENGGGIVFPENYPGEFPKKQKMEGYYIVPFAMPEIRPLEVLDLVSSKTGIALKSFSRMTSEEIVSLTGLSAEEAANSKQRHFSEPYILPERKSDRNKIINLLSPYNYKSVTGGRFAHLIPKESGKGNAVKYLIAFYRKLFTGKPVVSIGLGDSENDYDFLSVTDIAIFIRNRGNRYKRVPKDWIKSRKYGVEGWAGEVRKIIFPMK